MVHAVRSYVIVQKGRIDIEYRDLEPNWLFCLEHLSSALVVRVVTSTAGSIIFICSNRGHKRVVDIDLDIVHGPKLS